MKKLESLLQRIDGKSYKAYKDLKGTYQFETYQLELVRIQGDPFASPSLLKISFNLEEYGYPGELYQSPERRLGLADYLHRLCHKHLFEIGRKRGSGNSGAISIQVPGQEVIPRTACEISGNTAYIRMYAGLPAQGRKVLAKQAWNMFFDEVPLLMDHMPNDSPEKLKNAELYALNNERAEIIRQELKKKKLLCFIANESILPRASAVNDRPLKGAVPFQSPDSLAVELEVNGDLIKGMGLPLGITVITGGGFHGKSTLLQAIEKGVYNHIPNDGRELCLTDRDAVKIRAEDGRFINDTNISPFINNLPFQKNTHHFSTENASGSTSQACNIIENLELGAKALLIDEDTSASNFMIRDSKVQELISTEKEPITSYIERIRGLYDEMGISSVLVIGGLGDYFAVADRVLMMDEYQVMDITKRAKTVVSRYPIAHHGKELKDRFPIHKRFLTMDRMKAVFQDRVKLKSRGLDELTINRDAIDIRALEQLVEPAQAQFIAETLRFMARNRWDTNELKKILDQIEEMVVNSPLSESLGEHGNLSYCRKYELGAAIARWRKAVVSAKEA